MAMEIEMDIDEKGERDITCQGSDAVRGSADGK